MFRIRIRTYIIPWIRIQFQNADPDLHETDADVYHRSVHTYVAELHKGPYKTPVKTLRVQ